jgi:3-hydroxymyristoyl/3-hydroxydecanoyl-(acyl carrier protein) dehydratase
MSFLFVDRITEFSPGIKCQGLKHITNDDVYLSYDKNNNLYFNPSMIGETLGQLAAWNAMFSVDFTKRPVAGVVESVRLHRNAFIGETLILESCIDSIDEDAIHYHSSARVGDELVLSISNALGPMLPMEDFIDESLIKKQFNEIHRPGEWDNSSDLSDNYKILQTKTPSIVPMSFDKIIEHEPGVKLVATKKITRQAPYFPDHFPNKPVLPLTVLLECKVNLAKQFISQAGYTNNYHLKELRKIKMNEFVYPGDEVKSTLIAKSFTEDEFVLRYRSEVSGRRVCVLEIVMTATRDI